MKDKTVTETAFDRPDLGEERPPAPGVVKIYCGGPCEVTAHPVTDLVTFGRDAAANVVVDDARVSRVHVRLEPADGGVRVTDLGSHNGTHIDGERVAVPRAPAPHGSVIRVGKTLLLVKENVVPFQDEPFADFPGLYGGPALNVVRLRIATYSESTSPVLIQGETGTGKEVVAAAMHNASGREGEFVALNCAAISPELVESELFGHSKGAFSGSSRQRQGLFRTADRGTLLLDEVGELTADVQSKLLRVLETNEVRAVGVDSHVKVDVRVLAATNRDLDAMVLTGQFRGDLLHRIAALRMDLPPLRDRMEDIPALCAYFLEGEMLTVGPQAMEALMTREWPGNVRELRNAIMASSAAARAAGRDQIRPDDLPAVRVIGVRGDAGDDEQAQIVNIKRALDHCGGNVTHAARELGMARSRLYETLKRLKIDPATFRRR